MAIQIKLRGGTYLEHENFIGANREVTIDTTANTLRVHDGQTPGGHPLTTANEFLTFQKLIIHEIEGMQNDFSTSHNHDDKYAQIIHNHTQYVEKIEGTKNVLTTALDGYEGISLDGNNSIDYVRTTRNGLLPYQAGGWSDIGTPSWRFLNGFFNYIDSHDINSQRVKATDYLELNGKRVYIGESFPASARVNDILIQI